MASKNNKSFKVNAVPRSINKRRAVRNPLALTPRSYNVKRSHVISLYAHKGGVGKTTLATNLAFAIASTNDFVQNNIFRILLIDADPQMNLTSHILSPDEFNKHLEHLELAIENKAPAKLDSMVDFIRGDISLKTMSKLNFNPWEPKGITDINKKLLLFKGSFESSEWMSQLSSELTVGKGLNINLFEDVLSHLKGTFELIIIDLNPSLSPLNKILLKASDFIICPICPDSFSKIGIRLLKRSFFDWYVKKNVEIKTKFMGFIINKCFIKNGRIIKEEEDVINQIRDCINDCGLPPNRLGFLENLYGLGAKLTNDRKTILELDNMGRHKILKHEVWHFTQNVLSFLSGSQAEDDSDEEISFDGLNLNTEELKN